MLLKSVRLALPVVYVPLGVVAPIAVLDTDYGWSIILFFYVPAGLLYAYLACWMTPGYHKAFWATTAVLALVTFAFEYAALALDIWNFTENVHRLWGPALWGAPIEEFIFWFGAPPLCLMVYLYYYRLLKGEPDG